MVSPDASTSGNYATSSSTNLLTLDGEANLSYCAATNKLTLTPQSLDGSTLTGTVVLQSGSPSGSGGSGGGTGGSAGGAATSTHSSGGAPAVGGTSGGGGSSGTTGTGGAAVRVDLAL